jgi:hypothetical protein
MSRDWGVRCGSGGSRQGKHCWHNAEDLCVPGPAVELKCCQCGLVEGSALHVGLAVWAFPDEHMGQPMANPQPPWRESR